jgi:hypothetical protein
MAPSEYHDSKESLVAAERRDNSDARAGLFGLIGLLVGGVLTYVSLFKVGMDWPKWLRFGLVIAGAEGSPTCWPSSPISSGTSS